MQQKKKTPYYYWHVCAGQDDYRSRLKALFNIKPQKFLETCWRKAWDCMNLFVQRVQKSSGMMSFK